MGFGKLSGKQCKKMTRVGATYLEGGRGGGNKPFGSRPEPGVLMLASILQLPPGEVPEGKARVHPIGHAAHPRKRI